MIVCRLVGFWAVQISVCDGLGTYQAGEFIHVVDLLLHGEAVVNLARDIILMTEGVQTVCHVFDIAKEIRHVLVQIESEDAWLE